MAYALIFPSLAEFPTWISYSSPQFKYLGPQNYTTLGVIPIEGFREDALTVTLLIPGTICCNLVVTFLLWLLSGRRRPR